MQDGAEGSKMPTEARAIYLSIYTKHTVKKPKKIKPPALTPGEILVRRNAALADHPIRELRLKLKMSQGEFGQSLGFVGNFRTGQVKVSMWENGLKPKPEHIEGMNRLAKERGFYWHIDFGLFRTYDQYQDFLQRKELEEQRIALAYQQSWQPTGDLK